MQDLVRPADHVHESWERRSDGKREMQCSAENATVECAAATIMRAAETIAHAAATRCRHVWLCRHVRRQCEAGTTRDLHTNQSQ